MTRLRYGRPYWLDRLSRPLPRYPYLRGTHLADVVVVGGGVTGCACAYLLARHRVRTMLLEAQRIGHGSTAASTALLMQEPDVDFRDLAKRYGNRAAAHIWKVSRRAVGDLVDTLAQLSPAVAAQRMASVYFSLEPDQMTVLTKELAARHRAGLSGRWLSPAALERLTGIEGAGAIATQGNAAIDPLQSSLAFARGAVAAGAQVYTHSHVRRITPTTSGVDIDLDRGQVHADRVIIATGYATPEFKPLASRFRMVTTYVIATPRLPKTTRSRMGLGPVMLWDTERPYHYARWTPDHRLMFGGGDRPRRSHTRSPSELDRASADLMADLTGLYPALRGVEPEYAWEGLFAATPDGLPYIGAHRRYPRHLFALGYGGNGLSFGFLAAQMLTRAIVSVPGPDDELFGFSRHR